MTDSDPTDGRPRRGMHLVLAVALGAALSASNGPAVGIGAGAALFIVFSIAARRS